MSLSKEIQCEAFITFSSQHPAYRTDLGTDENGNSYFTRPQIGHFPQEVSLTITCANCGLCRGISNTPGAYSSISNQFGILQEKMNWVLASSCRKANEVTLVEPETSDTPVTPQE